MSTLNFVQQDDQHATVMVDTLNTHGSEVSKMMPLPHLGAIVAGRGRMYGFLVMLNGLLTHCGSFDEAFDKAEGLSKQSLNAAAALDAQVAAALGVEAEVYSASRGTRFSAAGGGSELSEEMLLVGWSTRENRVRAIAITAAGADDALEVTLDPVAGVAPADQAVFDALQDGPLTDGKALALVRQQHAPFDRRAELGLGGRLLLGRVARGEMSVRDLGDL